MDQTFDSAAPRAKGLPRAENGKLKNVFSANGKTYYILSDGDAFPIGRWMLWGKFTQQFLSGQDFQSMYNVLHNIGTRLDAYTRSAATFSEIVLTVEAAKSQLKDLSDLRYDTGLYLATLFILRDGENIGEWTQAQAEEKISDWAAEGYTALDFFDLSATMVIAYLGALRALADAMMTGQEPEPETGVSEQSAPTG